MADNDQDLRLKRIELGLKTGLQAYELARTRGDFYENVFWIHGELEHALDVHLGEQAKTLAFPQKVELFLPDVYTSQPVLDLNRRRNDMGHPRRRPTDQFVCDTARRMVDLAVAAWPGLFGHPAPSVRHPACGGVIETIAPQPLPPPPSAPGYPTPQSRVDLTVPAPTPAPARPMDSNYPPEMRGGLALLGGLVVFVLAVVLGLLLFAPRDTPAGPATPVTSGEIELGGRVAVSVPPGKVLELREAPGINQKLTARYRNGNVLEVTGGPYPYEAMIWWKVKGMTGSGWTAVDHLAPVED